MVMSEEVMTILFSQAYAGSAIVFRIYLLLLPLRTTTFGSFFLSTGHTNEIAKLVLIEVFMNLLLSIVLIRRFGMLGAAVATVIAEYITNIGLYLWRIHKIIEIPYRRLYPYGWQLKVVCLFCVPGLLLSVSKLILPSAAILRIVVGGIAYFAFSLVLLILTGWIPLRTGKRFRLNLTMRGDL
jgi:O-antigen/teichoic acid export membrane protein